MNRCGKGAPGGRLLISALHLALLLTAMSRALALNGVPHCSASSYSASVQVRYVIDGDTVILGNGEKVRLIGLDTPELGHDGKASEAGAVAARDYLHKLLHQHTAYPLVYGRQRRDHYGRTLAHLFLPDGSNVQAMLLAGGHATRLSIPPNLAFLECYRAQTEAAVSARRGIWRFPQYQPIDVTQLSGSELGYRIVTGKVTGLRRGRSSLWVDMGNRLALRIARQDLNYFESVDLDGLTGKYIIVHGMVYHRNGQLRIRVRLPLDMQRLGSVEKSH
ncbi:MAG: thermonuclease family protein [Gammaproteobacteria bacterium]